MLARNAADDFHRDLTDRVTDVTSWARLDAMRAIRFRDVGQELAELLRRLLHGREVYRGVASLDTAGEIVASAGDVAGLQRSSRPDRPRLVVLAE